MRLRLVEVPERALKDDQVEVLPPLGQLGALHKRLAAVAMGKLNEEQKRSQDRRAAELAAETASGGETVRSEADVTAQKEETRPAEARRMAKKRAESIKTLLDSAKGFFEGGAEDGEGGKTFEAAEGEEEEEEEAGKRQNNNDGGDDDDDDDDDAGYTPVGPRAGRGAGRLRFP